MSCVYLEVRLLGGQWNESGSLLIHNYDDTLGSSREIHIAWV